MASFAYRNQAALAQWSAAHIPEYPAMKELFLLGPGTVFLNHGSYGAVPRPVFDAWQRWQYEIERNPVLFLGRRSAGLLRAARERLLQPRSQLGPADAAGQRHDSRSIHDNPYLHTT